MIHRNLHARNMLACYEQSGPWADGSILTQHERELKASYERRCKSLVAPGFYRYLLDAYKVLWGTEPARTGADPLYLEGFTYNSGYGQSLSDALKGALIRSQVLGSCFLVVDSFAEQPDSREQMLSERSYPYLELVHSFDVLGLQVDRTGALTLFAYQYEHEGETYTRTYTPYAVTDTRLKDKASTSMEIPVRMPVIPVAPGIVLQSGETPPSPSLSLYQMQKAITNTLSMVSEEIAQTSFPLLVLNAATAPNDSARLGVAQGLHLQPGESASYLVPSSDTVSTKLAYADRLKGMMIETTLNLLTNSQAQSGVAKELDRAGSVQGLRALAAYMEKVEYSIYELFCQWLHQAPSTEYKVRYSRAYTEATIADYLTSALDILGGDFSEATKKAVRKETVARLFADDELLSAQLMQAEEEYAGSEPGVLDTVPPVPAPEEAEG